MAAANGRFFAIRRGRPRGYKAGVARPCFITCAMTKKYRSDLGQNIRRHNSDSSRVRKATQHLRKLVENIHTLEKPAIPQIPKEEFDDIERLIAAILSTLRANHFAAFQDDFKPREIRQRERKELDRAYKDLRLTGRWNDHVSAAETNVGTVFVTEPYGLQSEDFQDFVSLERAGWKVVVDVRWATYFPGHAIFIMLRPPSAKVGF